MGGNVCIVSIVSKKTIMIVKKIMILGHDAKAIAFAKGSVWVKN